MKGSSDVKKNEVMIQPHSIPPRMCTRQLSGINEGSCELQVLIMELLEPFILLWVRDMLYFLFIFFLVFFF